MGIAGSVIETGVDKLVDLVNKKGRISSNDAAIALGVSNTVIMEWADFLEEEGIISIEYKFTKQFLVARKLAKKDLNEKAKEFSGKKEVFVRKAEASLSFIERESKKLGSIKQEFDDIKKNLGFDIGHIKDELEELRKCEQLKISLDKQIEGQRATAMDKLQAMTKQISIEKKKYYDLLKGIKKEEEVLEKDRIKARSLEESEKFLKEKLKSLKDIVKNIESKAKTEEESVKISEEHIKKFKLMADKIKDRIEKEKNLIEPLVEKSKNQTEKMKQLQDTIIKKMRDKEKKLKNAKQASKKIQALFKRKMEALNLIEKVNKDKNDLKNGLIALLKKAKSFQLSSKSIDAGKEMTDLERKFKEVDTKRKSFETELKKMSSVLR